MAAETTPQDPAPTAAAASTADAAGSSRERGRPQTKVGTVVSNKMDKTVVVAVEKTVIDRLYRRYTKRRSKFTAHDEQNACRVGDQVLIVSSRPLSKTKRWRVREILRRAEEA
jgi:small subunit ribosomal protein S17